MAGLPDFDALVLGEAVMFEKAKPSSASHGAIGSDLTSNERERLRGFAAEGAEERFAAPAARRGGDALRALEWGELTARLNAARDFRLLLRTESQASIHGVAASFGDAAARYFALLDDGEPDVNRDALVQSKALGVRGGKYDMNRHDRAEGKNSDAPRGDARDMQ
jgi:hypothetical protein